MTLEKKEKTRIYRNVGLFLEWMCARKGTSLLLLYITSTDSFMCGCVTTVQHSGQNVCVSA